MNVKVASCFLSPTFTGGTPIPDLKRWEADYQLEEIDRLYIFDEYIEMSKGKLRKPRSRKITEGPSLLSENDRTRTR